MGDNLSKVEELSPRQREILRLIAKHLQAKEVAQLLNITERTVKTHTEAARKRLGVATSREAARMVIEYESRMGRPEAEVPIGLDDRWPSRPIDSLSNDLSASGHGRRIYPETTILSGSLERVGSRVADAGSPIETGPHRRDAERHTDSGSSSQLSGQFWKFWEGDLLGDRGHGVADRRRAEFQRQLRAISTPQWLGLIALIAVASALLMGGLITSALGTLEKLNLHAG